jgi:hypothetical protein
MKSRPNVPIRHENRVYTKESDTMWKLISSGVLLAMLGGCSATSLRCGVDGEGSFVELYNVPQNFSQNVRSYGELCGFAYEKTEPVGVLKIEDAN